MHFTPAEAQRKRKEDRTMKTSIAKKTSYIGLGAGLVIFVLFGLLPGSLLGGAAGINIAGWFFGLPLESGLVSRIIVFMSMLMGILVSGIAIITATSTMGWIVGRVIDATMHEKAAGKNNTLATAERRK
jgi:small-conductance mechanosensitive channel